MGADWYSSAVIGVRVREADCYRTERVKAFDHDHPDDWQIDPVTGKTLWKKRRTCVFANEEDKNQDVEWFAKMAAGFRVFESGCNGDSEYLIIGFGVTTGSSRGDNYSNVVSLLEDMDVLKGELEEFLSPHGLWDPEKFGLWALLSVSV